MTTYVNKVGLRRPILCDYCLELENEHTTSEWQSCLTDLQWRSRPHKPEDWTPAEWADLDRSLRELAAADPAIAAAEKRLHDHIDDDNWRNRHGITKYRATKGKPC